MKQYHKIQTVFKRDPDNNFKTLIDGDYSLPEFKYLSKNYWTFTEKVDGTNIRIMYDGLDKPLRFGGKTDNAQIPTQLAMRLNDIFLSQIETFKETFGETPACFYGEGYGAKIQKGGNYRPDQDFILFDVKIEDWWLRRDDALEIAQKFGLEIVPIIGVGSLAEMVEKTKEGFNSQWGDFLAEGIVARPAEVELFSRRGERIITKIKHKDFQ